MYILFAQLDYSLSVTRTRGTQCIQRVSAYTRVIKAYKQIHFKFLAAQYLSKIRRSFYNSVPTQKNSRYIYLVV